MTRPREAYYTPESATLTLLKWIKIKSDQYVWEPCVGTGAIQRVIERKATQQIVTNDINLEVVADFHDDAVRWMTNYQHGTHWIVTNPPFSQAPQIVSRAHKEAHIGVAMLLRLTFLEPCEDRVAFLQEYPPNCMLVLPRISFTGDGKTDNVTCAWMIWYTSSNCHDQPLGIHVVAK